MNTGVTDATGSGPWVAARGVWPTETYAMSGCSRAA